tara:strand:+ start:5108 stop:5560 length:453 start_codon:yes stop_codon:yes gene_type:complete
MVEVTGIISEVSQTYRWGFFKWYHITISDKILGANRTKGRILVNQAIMNQLISKDQTKKLLKQLRRERRSSKNPQQQQVYDKHIADLEKGRVSGETLIGMEVHLIFEPTKNMKVLKDSAKLQNRVANLEASKKPDKGSLHETYNQFSNQN